MPNCCIRRSFQKYLELLYYREALARQHYHLTRDHFKNRVKSKLNKGTRTYDIRGFRPKRINFYFTHKSLTMAEERCHHTAEQGQQPLSCHCCFHVDCHVSCMQETYCIMVQMAQLVAVGITFIKISWNLITSINDFPCKVTWAFFFWAVVPQ